MKMSRASVIVVSWNGEQYLKGCLDALLPQIGQHDEIVVVDNGSSDGSVALVRGRYPQVRLIENGRNLGFAGGCNVGLRATVGEYAILVNQDVIVRERWLEAMLAALTPPAVGIVGCKLLYPDGSIQHAGGIVDYPLAHPNHHGYRQPDRGQWDRQRDVDYVIGAAIGLKRAVLDEIGMLDEGFFPAFYEETDLCFRARAADYQVVYTPDAIGVHHEGTTIDRERVDYHRWMGRGRLRFVLKHYTAEQFHGDFVSAERDWLATLVDPTAREGMQMAYLDTLLGLRDMPRIGVLSGEGEEEAVAEALIGLREVLIVSAGNSLETASAPGPLAGEWWLLREHRFTSRVPFLGPAIARFRELWNSVATKWYVRPVIEQQNEINRRFGESLAMVEDKAIALDREAADMRRLYAQAIYEMREELDLLRARIRALEKEIGMRSEQEDEA